jgi:CDP-4-dehydro-6-deoxyglucose reductase
MTWRVRLEPGGRECEIGPHDTVLEAGLRAGLSLPYRCSNGTCGECRGRVLAGELGQIDFHDFRFSEAEKTQGYVLLCRARAAGDLIVEAQETGGVEDIPEQSLPAKVTRLEQPLEDVLIVHMRTPRSQTLQFLAGQHVTLQIDDLPRCDKALASCPCDGLHLQMHFRRRPGDALAEYVFDVLKPSKQVHLQGPHGAFTLDETSRRRAVFVAFDTGFGQIKSLIEHAISLEVDTPIHLFWIAPEPGGHYLGNHCRSWADALDDLCYMPLALPPGPGSLQQRLLATMADVWVAGPDWSDCDVYLAVPEVVRDVLTKEFHARGLPPERLRIDTVSDV